MMPSMPPWVIRLLNLELFFHWNDTEVKHVLAHLSTKGSSYFDRPLSVVVRRASSNVRRLLSFIHKKFKIFSSETAHWILTTLYRNYPWVVPYQSCSNGSDWLHKQVKEYKIRFSKCNIQKSSSVKLQVPYLVYSII